MTSRCVFRLEAESVEQRLRDRGGCGTQSLLSDKVAFQSPQAPLCPHFLKSPNTLLSTSHVGWETFPNNRVFNPFCTVHSTPAVEPYAQREDKGTGKGWLEDVV